jgi:hypothetical protein
MRLALIGRLVQAGGRLKVRSALNPILWLCAIVSGPALIIALFRSPPPTWFIVAIFLPISAAVFGFIFLLLFDRDKLQSEEYQLRKRSLELIEQKGSEPIVIDAATEIVAELKSIPESERQDG